MKECLNLYGMDLKRTILSFRWLFSYIGLLLLELIVIVSELPWGGNVKYFYEIIDYMGMGMAYLIFAVIPGTSLFYADWENQYIRFIVMRSNKISYGISKVISSFVGAFLVVFCAEMTFVLLLSSIYPISGEGNQIAWGPLSLDGYLYFLTKIALKSSCAAFFSVVSLWVSSKVDNVFVAYASPMICFYILDNICSILSLPAWLNIKSISTGVYLRQVSDSWWLLYGFVFFIVLSAIVALDFIFLCKGRTENG